MEVILISVLTIIGMCLGIFIGRIWGEEVGYQIGHDDGFSEGIEVTLEANKVIENFPTTLDGKFFSAKVAMRDISNKEGDK